MTPLPAAIVANDGSTIVPWGTTTAVLVRLAVGVFEGVDVVDGVGVCVTNRYPPFAALVAATLSKDDPNGTTTGVTVRVDVGVAVILGVSDGVAVSVI